MKQKKTRQEELKNLKECDIVELEDVQNGHTLYDRIVKIHCILEPERTFQYEGINGRDVGFFGHIERIIRVFDWGYINSLITKEQNKFFEAKMLYEKYSNRENVSDKLTAESYSRDMQKYKQRLEKGEKLIALLGLTEEERAKVLAETKTGPLSDETKDEHWEVDLEKKVEE